MFYKLDYNIAYLQLMRLGSLSGLKQKKHIFFINFVHTYFVLSFCYPVMDYIIIFFVSFLHCEISSVFNFKYLCFFPTYHFPLTPYLATSAYD